MQDQHIVTVTPATDVDKCDYGEHTEIEVAIENTNVYEEEAEPELHARTWIAVAAFFLLNYTQVVALQGPTAVVCSACSQRRDKF
jgi:hypothetical protein